MKCPRLTNDRDALHAAGHLEELILGRGSYTSHMVVLQRVLRDMSRLLVFGPRYEDMRVVPLCPYEDLFKRDSRSTNPRADFFIGPQFAAAARLFSRVFCQAGLAADESEEDPVPPARCEASARTIEALFEHGQGLGRRHGGRGSGAQNHRAVDGL